MKTTRVTLLLALFISASSLLQAAPLGTAFTYQRRLTVGTNMANGSYDLKFSLYDALTSGSQIGASLTNAATSVTNGYFTVTLNFGDVFDGHPRWLEIGVRTNGPSPPGFTTLTPRQPLTPSPYALYALNAGAAGTASTAGGVANNSVTSAGIAPGQVVKSLNGLRDDVAVAVGANATLTPSGNTLTLATPTDWHVGGNADTTAGTDFLGTRDDQPLEFKVNGQRALQLEPTVTDAGHQGIVNVVSGSGANQAGPGVYGVTIAGGGAGWYYALALSAHTAQADFTTIGGGLGQRILADSLYGTIGGGVQNTIETNAVETTISGGRLNWIQANSEDSTIGGGYGNTVRINASYATIGGGSENTVSGYGAVIAGGRLNRATNQFDAVAGGINNQARGNRSTVAGGDSNIASGPGAFVGGGGWDGSTVAGNTASGWASTIGGGLGNTVYDSYSTVAGDLENSINGAGEWATIGGGWGNGITGALGDARAI